MLALLAQVRCPTLVLHATRDALVPHEQGRLLARSIAQARLVSLDSGNHDLLATEPAWPVLCHEVRGFLAEHDAAAAVQDGRSLAMLSDREREIICLRFGIVDGYTYTLEEVGRRFNVTRERIRQIEAKSIKKLQHPTRARKLEGFIDNKLT